MSTPGKIPGAGEHVGPHLKAESRLPLVKSVRALIFFCRAKVKARTDLNKARTDLHAARTDLIKGTFHCTCFSPDRIRCKTVRNGYRRPQRGEWEREMGACNRVMEVAFLEMRAAFRCMGRAHMEMERPFLEMQPGHGEMELPSHVLRLSQHEMEVP
ncbi:MAG: hypothetical protein EA377_00355 [Phycisphaerales bacterium]|nr:MAG: hypothetical protein EA377_00355 [Phycisphaerales bacterium]